MQKIKYLSLLLSSMLTIGSAYSADQTIVQVGIRSQNLEQDTVVSFIYATENETGPGTAISFKRGGGGQEYPFGGNVTGDKISITHANVRYGVMTYKYSLNSDCNNIDITNPPEKRKYVWINLIVDPSTKSIYCYRWL